MNFNHLDQNKQAVVLQNTAKIQDAVQRTAVSIIEIGRVLSETKELINHGDFGTWITESFGWTRATANRYLHIYQQFGTYKQEELPTISVEALALLAAPSTPDTAVAEAVEKKNSDNRPLSLKETKELVNRHKKNNVVVADNYDDEDVEDDHDDGDVEDDYDDEDVEDDYDDEDVEDDYDDGDVEDDHDDEDVEDDHDDEDVEDDHDDGDVEDDYDDGEGDVNNYPIYHQQAQETKLGTVAAATTPLHKNETFIVVEKPNEGMTNLYLLVTPQTAVRYRSYKDDMDTSSDDEALAMLLDAWQP